MVRKAVGLLSILLSISVCLAATTVTLCAEDDFYPYSANVHGRPQGMTVALMRAAFAEVGIDAQFALEPYNRCLESVRRGKYVGTFDTAQTPERQAYYLWSKQAITEVRVMSWGAVGLPFKQVDYADLHGKRVGIVIGYEYPPALLDDPAIIKVQSGTQITNLRNVAAGRLDFAPIDVRVAEMLLSKHGLSGKVAGYGELSSMPLHAVFSPAHPQGAAMLARFDQGWTSLQAKGGVKRIEAAWLAGTAAERDQP